MEFIRKVTQRNFCLQIVKAEGEFRLHNDVAFGE